MKKEEKDNTFHINKEDRKQIEKGFDMVKKMEILQAKYEHGKTLTDKEIKPIADYLNISVEDFRRGLNGEDIEHLHDDQPAYDRTSHYRDFQGPDTPAYDKTGRYQADVDETETLNQTKQDKALKTERQYKAQKNRQKQFDEQDKIYQDKMVKGHLSDEEIREISAFYNVNDDTIRTELKENNKSNPMHQVSDASTYAKDKQKAKKKAWLSVFKRK